MKKFKMPNIPITVEINENKFTDSINTDEAIGVSQIIISNDYKIYYLNDLAQIDIVFNGETNISLDILKSCSNKELETLEDYRFAVQCYLLSFSKMILKKIPINWDEFKNYINCQISFENSFIDVNINVKEEYKPDEEFEFAKKKFMNLHNIESDNKWRDNRPIELTSLDLNFVRYK
jgi:hypothetical protein